MRPPKTLILITLLLLVGFSTLLFFLNKKIAPQAVSIQTSGNPVLGSSAAQVDLVLFTDPKCSGCKEWHETVFPELQRKYIQTEKVRLTVIPISVVSGSSPGGNALLCIYNQAPLYPNTDLFFKFLSTLYNHQDETWTDPLLIDLASKTDITINLPKLKACTELNKWEPVIKKNTLYARELTGNQLKVPTLFLNGIRLKDLSLENLFNLIETQGN